MAIQVENLVKSYGPVQAVRGVSFEAGAGEIFGLLGPNGAGKSSTLECVVGLRGPDSGRVTICGVDAVRHPRKVKELIGVALQATALPDKISAREALRLFASFYRGAVDVEELISRFSLLEKADASFETLSGGQKQRLAIALAMVNEPKVIFLDEPTAGLDPQSRRELHEVILRAKREGKTVILSTHYIEEAQQLCDRIGIVDHGRIIAMGTPGELVAGAKAKPHVEFTATRRLELEKVRAIAGVTLAKVEGESAVLHTDHPGSTIIDLVNWLQNDGGNELVDLRIRKPSLEDVFIELTGRSIRD